MAQLAERSRSTEPWSGRTATVPVACTVLLYVHEEHMAIYGIGTDIIQVSRVAAVMERTNGRFASRVLGPDELAVYEARKARSASRGLAYLSTRFSAKEAFSKAIGLGMHMPMTWRAVQTLNEPGGKPVMVASGALAQWLDERGITMRVTISDEQDYAVSFVIAETADPAR